MLSTVLLAAALTAEPRPLCRVIVAPLAYAAPSREERVRCWRRAPPALQ